VYFLYHFDVLKPQLSFVSGWFAPHSFIAGRIILVLFVAGFSLLVFTKEKNEQPYFTSLRFKALSKTVVLLLCWIMVYLVFFVGNESLLIYMARLILPFLIYLILFKHLKYKERKIRRYQKLQQQIK
jgi:glucose uptake protein GlcU